tara:strand:+ start:419 stop:577 length:159 start_codon:yes stop_codon:yes gene_type:complete
MAVWTKAELEQLSPFGQILIGTEEGARPMTREEYDEWIKMGVGVEKPEEEVE